MIPTLEFGRKATMPRYFFHVRANGTIVRDSQGVHLPNADCVTAECLRSVTNAIASEESQEETLEDFEFQVESEAGEIILVLPFRL